MGTKLKLLNSDGRVWETQLDPTTSIQTLKNVTFDHFYPEPTELSPFQFRLIYASDFRTLSEYHAIKEAKLSDADTLLFVQHRVVLLHELLTESELNSPTMSEIKAATKNLPTVLTNSKNKASAATSANSSTGGKQSSSSTGRIDSTKDLIMMLHHETVDPTVDFQVELRKMIISLISVMAVILGGNPDVEQICQEMKSKLKVRIKHINEHRPAPSATTATAHSSKDTPNSTSPLPPPSFLSEELIISSPMDIVETMTRIKKFEFQPEPKALEKLKEMGFNEAQIIDALRANKNKSDKAAEWLLGDNHIVAEDTIIGLDPTCHLYNSLVSDPTIRLGLGNPKTLLAFLCMIDSSSSAGQWLNDPDVSNTITTMFKVYHSEKHVISEDGSSSPKASSSK